MGSLFGGGKSSSTQTTSTGPWAPQQGYLRDVFQQAQTNFNDAQGRPAYQGALSAPMNDQQREAMAVGSNFARGPGGAIAGNLASTAGNLNGTAESFAQNAGTLAQGGAGPVNATAQGTLTAAAGGAPMAQFGPTGTLGVNGQTAALGTAQQLASAGQQDLNPTLQQQAQGYVDEGRVQGQVDAALRDVGRNLNENTLPGLNARAVAGGNLNSARAGAAEAVARRAAEDRASDLASGIRSEAYNTGLSAALQANQQQNNLALGANAQASSTGGALANLGENQRQFDASSRLSAAGTLGALDTSNRSLDAQTRLNANAQVGDAARIGMQAGALAGDINTQNAQKIAAEGDALQAEQNRQIAEAQAQYYAPEMRAQQNLANYAGIVASNNWGSEGTATTTSKQPGNILGGVLGTAALAAAPFTGGTSMLGGFGNLAGGVGSALGLVNSNRAAPLTSTDPLSLPTLPTSRWW